MNEMRELLYKKIHERDLDAVKFMVSTGLVPMSYCIDYCARVNDAWLIDEGVIPTDLRDETLKQAFIHDAPNVVRAYLARGWDPNSLLAIRMHNTLPALSNAACMNLAEIAELLIVAGADVNVVHERDADYVVGLSVEPQSPLYYAAERGFTRTALVLLRAGAHVNDIPDRHASHPTILHAAACAGNDFIVETLLAFGADPNPNTPHAPAPLYLAVKRYYAAAGAALLESGATLDEYTLAALRDSDDFRRAWDQVLRIRANDRGIPEAPAA